MNALPLTAATLTRDVRDFQGLYAPDSWSILVRLSVYQDGTWALGHAGYLPLTEDVTAWAERRLCADDAPGAVARWLLDVAAGQIDTP